MYQKSDFIKIQDGGGRHIGFRQVLITFERIKRFQSDFNRAYLMQLQNECICKNDQF